MYTFLAAISSLRSDNVTLFACLFVWGPIEMKNVPKSGKSPKKITNLDSFEFGKNWKFNDTNLGKICKCYASQAFQILKVKVPLQSNTALSKVGEAVCLG